VTCAGCGITGFCRLTRLRYMPVWLGEQADEIYP
jgi:hypothetical protein